MSALPYLVLGVGAAFVCLLLAVGPEGDERRLVRLKRTDVFVRMARQFAAMQYALGAALMPAVVKAAKAMAEFQHRLAEVARVTDRSSGQTVVYTTTDDEREAHEIAERLGDHGRRAIVLRVNDMALGGDPLTPRTADRYVVLVKRRKA